MGACSTAVGNAENVLGSEGAQSSGESSRRDVQATKSPLLLSTRWGSLSAAPGSLRWHSSQSAATAPTESSARGGSSWRRRGARGAAPRRAAWPSDRARPSPPSFPSPPAADWCRTRDRGPGSASPSRCEQRPLRGRLDRVATSRTGRGSRPLRSCGQGSEDSCPLANRRCTALRRPPRSSATLSPIGLAQASYWPTASALTGGPWSPASWKIAATSGSALNLS